MAPRKEPQPGLGAAIRELRERADLSQEALAHRADVHPTWVSHLESGRANPSWGTVRRIAAGLGVTLADIARLAEDFDANRS